MLGAKLNAFFYGCALAALGAGAAWADTPSQQQGSENTLQAVVVTARRTAENLQTVPVAVSAITQKTLDQNGSFAIANLSEYVPNLHIDSNYEGRENLIFTIRGQNYTSYAAFEAVIPYFAEIPITNPFTSLTTGAIFDMADIEVYRGPQGVLFGRVTDGGNVMLYPKRPGPQLDGFLEVKVGDYGLNNYTGAVTVPIIPDVLTVRGAVDIERRGGFTTNVLTGENVDNIASEAYRLGVVWKPTSSFEQYTVVQYQHTHDNGTSVEPAAFNPTPLSGILPGTFGLFPGAYGINSVGDVVPFQPGLTPLTTAAYLADMQQQVAIQQALGPRKIYYSMPLYDERSILYVSNSDTYNITPDIYIKNIFGFSREIQYEVSSYTGGNGALIETCHEACAPLSGYANNIPWNTQDQFSEEFQIHGKSFDHRLTWLMGAYYDYQHPTETFENDTIQLGILLATGVALITDRSRAGFGYAEYDASDWVKGLKFNGGVRYTVDSAAVASNASPSNPIAGPLVYSSFLSTGTAPFVAGLLGITPAQLASEVVEPPPFGECINYPGGLGALGGGTPCERFAHSWSAVTWTAGASYTLPSGQMFYAKGSRGYRPGGFFYLAAPGVNAAYQPEYDLSVEVEFKGDFDINGVRLRIDLDGFHDNYTNIQEHVTIRSSSGQSFGTLTNVQSAIVQGVEFEGLLQPTHDLQIGLTYAYIDAHYVGGDPLAGTINDPCDPTVSVVIGFCNANRFADTPKMQVGVTLNYTLPLDEAMGKFTIGGHYYYQSSEALVGTSALNPESIQPGYSLLDLNASWTQFMGKPIDLSFFMTNVTNQLYLTGVDDLLQNSSIGSFAKIYAPPRMFGFGLKYRFGAGAGG